MGPRPSHSSTQARLHAGSQRGAESHGEHKWPVCAVRSGFLEEVASKLRWRG